MIEIKPGDCLEVLKTLPTGSVDSLVTDPPAGISFMGKDWDSDKGGREEWIKWMSQIMSECHRVLKPGAHGLIWAIPRTSHWTATALEDVGFEVRDVITHLFGSGFPKSLDVKKASEKAGISCVCPKTEASSDLPKLQEGVYSEKQDCAPPSQDVLLSVQRCNQALAPGTCCSPSGNCAEHEGQKAEASLVRPCQSVLARGGDIQTDQGQLYRPEVRQMPGTPQGDGPEGRLCNGTPSSDGSKPGKAARKGRSRSPQGPQHPEQRTIQSGTISKQPRPQTCGRCGKPQVQAGFGTALKPAAEFWILARKPLSEKTVATNVLTHGTGALNIDGCRIEAADADQLAKNWDRTQSVRAEGNASGAMGLKPIDLTGRAPAGRFPANLVLSHSPHCTDDQCDIECAIRALDEQSGISKSVKRPPNASSPTGNGNTHCAMKGLATERGHADSGGASRFFYVAKISSSERNAGLEGMPQKLRADANKMMGDAGTMKTGSGNDRTTLFRNHHPTVKPIKLMRYLCRLVTPPGGTVLDPFMGSGSTGMAAVEEGFGFIGIEREPDYVQIAEKRIFHRFPKATKQATRGTSDG